MRLYHPQESEVRSAGALRATVMLTARWEDIAFDTTISDEVKAERALQLASLAIARAEHLERDHRPMPAPTGQVVSIQRARSNRKATPAPQPRPGA